MLKPGLSCPDSSAFVDLLHLLLQRILVSLASFRQVIFLRRLRFSDPGISVGAMLGDLLVGVGHRRRVD